MVQSQKRKKKKSMSEQGFEPWRLSSVGFRRADGCLILKATALDRSATQTRSSQKCLILNPPGYRHLDGYIHFKEVLGHGFSGNRDGSK